MGWLSQLPDSPLFVGLISTGVLVLALLVLRAIFVRAILANEKLAKEVRRRWLVQLRTAILLLFVLGLVMIWAEELRLFAVSIFAVAVAAVIATKELIQCVTGALFQTGGKAFKIGDRIEISGIRGDVIDHNLLTTTVMEIGLHQVTGRAVVLPNSVFLGKPLVNESYTHDFVLHAFKVPLKMDAAWQNAEQDLLTAAKEECTSFLEEARRHFARFTRYEGLASLGVDPRINVSLPKAGELELVVRVAVPARRKGRIEQAILRRYLALTAARAAAKESEKAAAKDAAGASTQARSPRQRVKPLLGVGTTRWRRDRARVAAPLPRR